MKKKIISCLLICVVIVLSYFYAHIDKNSYIYNRNADTGTFYSTGILTDGEQVMQSFVVEEDTIDGINIKVALAGNVEKVVVKYAILDENSEKVYENSIPAIYLESNKFNKLKIEDVTDTNGKTYTLALHEEKSDEQNGVSFYLEPGRQENQQLLIRDNETDGTLVLRTICHRFDVETFMVLLGMIAFVVGFMKVLYKLFK